MADSQQQSESQQTPSGDADSSATAKTSDTKRQADSAPQEPRFSRERLLSADGPVITGHPVHVIAGALHDNDGEEFSRQEIDSLIRDFLNRPVEAAA